MFGRSDVFRILLVDDDPIRRTLLRDHLGSDGQEVLAVKSACQAMSAFEHNSIHVVIVDWPMADVYDALTSKRVFKASLTHAAAQQMIAREAGGQFDPTVAA